MVVVSLAPPHIVTRYLRGECWAMAVELSRKTGLEIWGLRDERGDIHHAFVVDAQSGLAIDIRGSMQIERVADGAVPSIPDKLESDEISMISSWFDDSDAKEAREVIRDYLRGVERSPRLTRRASLSM